MPSSAVLGRRPAQAEVFRRTLEETAMSQGEKTTMPRMLPLATNSTRGTENIPRSHCSRLGLFKLNT